MAYGPTPKSAEERFWARVHKTDGCWYWGGVHFGNKYGLLMVDGKNKTSHRFSYEIHKGEIPVGGIICHTCDVRNCVNPEHLYCGTHEDNTRDIIERKRFGNAIGHRPRARPGLNPKNRALSEKMRKEMIEEYRSGKYTQAQLAYRYRITQATVSSNIRNWPNRKPDGGKVREGHFRRKVAVDVYDQIRQRYATGEVTQKELAAEYGLDQTYISSIIKRKTRRDLREQRLAA